MPKNTKADGATYAGLVDVSPSDRSQPEWVAPEPKAVVASYLEDELPEAKPKKAKNSTTAKAGAARGSGSTRA